MGDADRKSPPVTKKDRKEKLHVPGIKAGFSVEGSRYLRPCYVHNKSSSDARLEIIPSRVSEAIDEVSVCEKVVLIYSSA